MYKVYVIVFCVIVFSSLSFSQLVFKSDLDGSQVVPAVSTPATGSAWLFLYEDLGAIRFGFTIADLQGNFTEARFNIGKPGEEGYSVQSIIVHNNSADDQWDNIPDSVLAYLLAEDIYISIHSSTFPGGEIRGQVKKIRGYGFPLGLMSDLMVPPVLTQAKATGYVVLNNNGTSIDYKFTVTGLSSNVTTLWFNIAPLGEVGPSVYSVNVQGNTISGSWTGFADSIIVHMIRNRFYLSLSTAGYPQGELRGNLFRHGELMFRVSLDGAQVSPPVTTTGTGTGWAVISSNFSKVFYDFTFAKLSSPVSSVYFYNGDEGTNGDSLIALSVEGNKATGTWNFFNDNLMIMILKKKIYVSVNTQSFPDGEIRGQLDLVRGIGFTSQLSGMGEIPANSSTAKGTGWLIYNSFDTDTDTAFYQFTMAGLSSQFTGAFFHLGSYNTNGPSIEPMPFIDSTLSYAWHITDPSILSSLMRGNIYADIHSVDYIDGEIRGQVYFSNVQSGNTVDIKDKNPDVPLGYELKQNYPNPFNPSTRIKYSIPVEEFVRIKVYNSLGEETAVLVNQVLKSGSYETEWNASRFASGIYFLRFEAGEFSSIRKMILIK